MRQEKVFFHPIEGSGQLSISWSAEPKGDAIEAKNGAGVGFFSSQGDLLSVLFDEVQAFKDHQILEFPHYKIEVSVSDGTVSYKMTRLAPLKPIKTSKRPRKI